MITKPNRIPKYSNLAMTIAGEIIERVSGIKYEDYIENNIFKSLEMSDKIISVCLSLFSFNKEFIPFKELAKSPTLSFFKTKILLT